MRIFWNIVFYVLGVQIIAIGIVLMVTSNLGVSVGTAVSFELSQKLTFLTLGEWNYLCHGFTMVLLVVLLRKAKIWYLAAFATSVFLGYSIDLWGLCIPFTAQSLFLRVLCLVLGIVAVAVGVSCTLCTFMPPAPFDLFVKELANARGWQVNHVKIGFDISCLCTGVALSFLFFAQLRGIGVGTAAAAVFIGIVMGWFRKGFGGKIQKLCSPVQK